MSLYRNIVWYIKGLREYTRAGYEEASKRFKNSDVDIDCTGKVIVITGGNSGIGKSIAHAVALKGATVHILCRNRQNALSAVSDLRKATGNEQIFCHIVNLSEPGQVREFAKDFAESMKTIDVLVNNAGCMTPKLMSLDGFEVNFATNSLSPYLLTKMLLPPLLRADRPRVIFVSSGGMLVQKVDYEDPQCSNMQPFDPVMAYAQFKRQQVVLTELLAKEVSGVFFASMHPGWADTPSVREAMPDFYASMKDKLRTPEQGADTAIWLAISSAAASHPSGLFFQDRVPVVKHLPLAWTKTTLKEDLAFKAILDDYINRLCPS